jgi:hypothetical protein
MKKVLATLLAITLTLGVFAQDSANTMNKMAQKQNMQKHDGVIMKDGKLLMMKNGQTTQLTSDLTLDNGTVVMTNGTVKAKDGSTTTLKEGDYVSMDGTTMGNINKWPKNNMGKDSTTSDKIKPDSVR